MKSSRRADALVILALLLLPLLWFAPQALGGKTLLPADNLYQYPPWKSYAAQMGVTVQNGTVVPYNGLISDLVLENAQWKSLITDALKAKNPGDILWNPRSFAGVPFFAAGQHSAAYPLSLLFYILPLWRAYGVFTWIQLGLAAACMFVFMRVLGVRRLAAALSGIAYAFSGFFITSVNFTMIIAAATWLPLLLACVEVIVRQVEHRALAAEDGTEATPHRRGWGAEPFVALGGVVLLMQALAGHVEITYYTLLVAAMYAVWRLVRAYLILRHSNQKAWPSILRTAGWLVAMVVLGLALGGVQLVPLYELVKESFREGSASLQQVRDWAWPSRQIFTFILPDFFGNPTHHAYFDIWRRTWVAVTQNAAGQPLYTIDWGVKNYVEGANYLGIATLVMAVLGAVAGIRKLADPSRRTHTWFFAVLAVLSMLFAFGTPLYAVLYYGLPGYSQLHSAFRWVFPYTLAMAALAGFGLDWLLRGPAKGLRLARVVGWAVTLIGAGSLLVVLLSILKPEPFIALGDKLLHWPFWSDLATTRGFADGAMFWSYEALQIARFGLIAVLTGVAILLLAGAARRGASNRVSRILAAGLLGVLVLDLWLVGSGFNPAVNPDLLKFTPPSLQFLQSEQDAAQPWRLTSLDPPDQKVLNANSAMSYGLEDIRGYDSIIPKQYVAYMDRIQPQTELLYNRIAPIYASGTLDNPLLSLLGTRYVVSTETIPNDGYKLVYDDEVKIYENTKAQGRAFIVPEAVAAADQTAALDKLQQINPANTVVIEGLPQDQIPPSSASASAAGTNEVRMSQRESREYFVDVNTSAPGWLVLTDNYFDGWKAYLRPFGASGEGVNASGESVEEQLPVYRADGTFRTVYIPKSGQWTVRFVYSPRSIMLGGYLTFLAGVTLLLVLAWWAWGRFYKGESSEVGTVAKNSAVQVVMNLFNRGIDFAFAMLRLRVLSPEGEGSYVFAITFYLILEIVTRFGLGTLLTRDVAFEKDKARKYLVNVLALRSGLWLLTLPVTAIVLYFFQHSPSPLTMAEMQTIAFFVLSLFFANIADAISSVFIAFEKMEYPAATATAVTLGKVALSALVLLPPFSLGFVGLAAVAVFMNVVQVGWLWILLEQKVLRPFERGEMQQRTTAVETQAKVEGALPGTHLAPGRVDWHLQRYMMRESWPLMINHLLATVFWRISQLVLRGAINPAAVGIFSAGIKYIDGLNVIPAYFTTAIFPLLSRYAHAGNDAFLKAYKLALQLLFMVALPIAVLVTFAATALIQVLGGAAYLPDSAIALRLMIWSIPIGFLNSVTQYTLIAANQQRFITRAFAIAVTATTIANLILVPRYGAVAASALMILAEASLFLPFRWAVQRYIGEIPWLKMLGRPLLATGANLVIVWGLDRLGVPGIVSLAAGFAVYVLLLLVLGAFRGEEFAVLRNILNRRLRRPAPEPTA